MPIRAIDQGLRKADGGEHRYGFRIEIVHQDLQALAQADEEGAATVSPQELSRPRAAGE